MLRLHGVVDPHLGHPRPALVREVEVRERGAVQVDNAAIFQIFNRGARVVGPCEVLRRRLLHGRHPLANELEDGVDDRVHSGNGRVR